MIDVVNIIIDLSIGIFIGLPIGFIFGGKFFKYLVKNGYKF